MGGLAEIFCEFFPAASSAPKSGAVKPGGEKSGSQGKSLITHSLEQGTEVGQWAKHEDNQTAVLTELSWRKVHCFPPVGY